MRSFSAALYERLLERSADPILQAHMRAEELVLANISEARNATVVDLGAGYGRILPILAHRIKHVVAVEINPAMLGELQRRAQHYPNVTVVEGDFNRLRELPQSGTWSDQYSSCSRTHWAQSKVRVRP
jgi:16S rRNA A1518/A1519 N6-dimethyltransferase RsmA/KsgA/DIM1 with predicted DNA glycosylase/AP lyase activity